MSWRTSPVLIRVRNLARSSGLNRLLGRFLQGRDYESRYQAAFHGRLREGDCVWDVGANVGHYTERFAEWVGSTGVVHAFEPSLSNFEELTHNCSTQSNVILHQFGLSDREMTVGFQQGTDAKGATSRIVESATDGTTIQVRSGSQVIEDGIAPAPTILKIDVEGFEWEVIQGLGEHVFSPDLRMLGVEVHFRILEESGRSAVPAQIETHLKSAGFRLRWSDPSHLVGIR